MKRKLTGFLVGILLLAVGQNALAASPAFLTFDFESWLGGLDRLYANYDMVQNTIQQIENQYKQIQNAIETAKNIDWENIRFDGDFDIRNDIRNAGKRVNRLLTQMRNIKAAIDTPSINMGNAKYSIKDLCCGTKGATWESDKNFFTAMKDYAFFMTENVREAGEAFSKGLEPEVKKAIMKKYGISAANYKFIHDTHEYTVQQIQTVMGRLSEEVQEAQANENEMRKSNIIKAATDTRDSNGSIPQGALAEANLYMVGELCSRIDSLQTSMYECASMSASKMIEDESKKEAEIASEADQNENKRKMDRKTSSRVQ